MSTNIPRQASDENKDGTPHVIISKPLGVAVTLFDYDIDGVENVSKDPDGKRCIASHWDARIEVRPQNQNPKTMRKDQPYERTNYPSDYRHLHRQRI